MSPTMHLILTPATVIAFVAGALFASVAGFIAAAAERLRSRRPAAAPALSPVAPDWDYIRNPRGRQQRRVRSAARRQSIPVVETKPAREAASAGHFDARSERDDVRDWLIGMGYSERAATKAARAARAADPDASVDQHIREALRLLPVEN